MNAKDILRNAAGTSDVVVKRYVDDLTDDELLKRPGPECNHLAWQLGHVISSECGLLNAVCPGKAVELPAGFSEKHSTENAKDDNAAGFCTKQEYLDLYDKVRAATSEALESLSEEDLDKPAPERMGPTFPTVGAVFVLMATHPLMHAGQFVPVRRALGKPIVI